MPSYNYGLLGSLLFVGVLLTIIPLPALADLYGRKKIYTATMVAELCVHALMVYNSNLNFHYFLIICTGMAFAGRVLVGLNLLIEFMHCKIWQENVVNFGNWNESLFSLFMVGYYKFVSNNWLGLFNSFFFMGLAGFLLVVIYVPESPRFLYSQGRYAEARNVIIKVALFNGVTRDPETGIDLKSFKFEKEIALIN